MKNKLLTIIICICIFYIYKNWFILPQVIGGDWPFYYTQALKDFAFPPLSWAFWRGNGLGGIDVSYSLHIYEHFTAVLSTFFHIPWPIIYKVFWFGLFLILNIFSISYLYDTVFSKKFSIENLIAVMIYSTNTYILLIASGGQMGYAVGYSLAPLVLGMFFKTFKIRLQESTSIKYKVLSIKYSLLTGLLLGLLLMIDLRVAYLCILVIGIYLVFNISSVILNKQALLYTLYAISYMLLIPLIAAFLLNLSWILPLILLKQNVVQEVGSNYNSIASLQFFSFADFSHAFSLLHPNWPENIFGKVYFLQPEFLVLPILAFCSLLFVEKLNITNSTFAKATVDKQKINNNRAMEQYNNGMILFFALLALLGVFLAKGTNDPFGFIYIFLYQHIPGFVMFRDPTKFYVFIALAYSILVPFSLEQIFEKVFSIQKKKILYTIYYILYTLLWLFLIRRAVIGQLNDTFQSHAVPSEYQKLADYLQNQNHFSRTLWLPRQQRFSYSTSIHPAVEAEPLFNATTSAEVLRVLPQKQQYLSDIGIKYIIVPYDPYGEIFQKDRKYNKEEYLSDIHALQRIPWLREISGFGNIAIFQMHNSKDHFFLTFRGSVNYRAIDTTHYQVIAQTLQPNTLVFSDAYNPYWAITINDQTIQSQQTNEGLNSFFIPRSGRYKLDVKFTQQKYYDVGFVLSAILFLGIIVAVIVLK